MFLLIKGFPMSTALKLYKLVEAGISLFPYINCYLITESLYPIIIAFALYRDIFAHF